MGLNIVDCEVGGDRITEKIHFTLDSNVSYMYSRIKLCEDNATHPMYCIPLSSKTEAILLHENVHVYCICCKE